MDNNTSYETQAIDLSLLSVLDITKEGKVVSAEKWSELWALVFKHINKIDTFCVDMQTTLDNWHIAAEELTELSKDMQMKYWSLSTGFTHYGEEPPQNPYINFWVRSTGDISTHCFLTNEDVDFELSSTSENPVQNKVVNAALNNKMDKNNPTGTGSFSLNRKSDTAVGDYSFTEGNSTTASGNISHAEGFNTEASSDYQHVQGKYNISDSNNMYADIVGNGTSNTKRSNAATVDWNGNAWYAGTVYVGSTSGTNRDGGSKKLATEKYVDTQIAEKELIVRGNGNHSMLYKEYGAIADGENSISLGRWTKSYNNDSISIGRELKNYSHCGINLGYDNIAGLEEYKNLHWNIFGALGCIVLGWGNRATHTFVNMFGDHNISSNLYQNIFGTYCAENPDALVIVGNGHTDVSGRITRSNLFEVTNSSVMHNGVALPAEEKGECELSLIGDTITSPKSKYHKVGKLVSIFCKTSCTNNFISPALYSLPFPNIYALDSVVGQGLITFNSNRVSYPIYARGNASESSLGIYIMVDNILQPIDSEFLVELSGSTEYTADIQLNIQYLTEV